jgi:hypothetical protein
MTLMRIGNRYFNMDLLVEADIVPVLNGKDLDVGLKFSGPQPASVGASDWVIECYEVRLRGEDAKAAMEWLDARGGRS